MPPEYAGRADEYVDLIVNEMIPTVAKEKLADAVDVFCESIAFSREQCFRMPSRVSKQRFSPSKPP